MRRFTRFTAFAAVLAAAGAASLHAWPIGRPVALDTIAGDATRGAYLARMSGCIACHTDAESGGPPLAGGVELPTDFGTFHAPNLTMDAEHGIGAWSIQDFAKAVRQGISPEGRPYYPAFPYPFYSRFSDQDIADLWAAFRTVPAVAEASPEQELQFPYSFRPALKVWRAMFLDMERLEPVPDKSEAWNRGRYIVRGPGHCGACHTPRNMLGARQAELAMHGADGLPDGGKSPPITADRLEANGWTVNTLEEATSIHWHGIRIDNAMDGVAGLTQEAVPTGGTFDYDFIAPAAGTYWYHAHNRNWNQVARGLYGPLIVEEEQPAFDRDHDLTLVIDDWRLANDGTLDVASLGSLMDWSHGDRLGNWLTVNGESLPAFALKAGEAYRLRLINAANARVLELDPTRFGAKVIAYDGQPLPEPVTLDYSPFLLGPAQRADLLVVPQGDFALEEISRRDPFAFVSFKVNPGDGGGDTALPRLAANAIPEPDLANAKPVRLEMTGGAMGGFTEIVYKGRKLDGEDFRDTGQVWAFNGVANLDDEPLFTAKRGETVVIETVNDTAWVHAMHTHSHHFRVIERSGATVDDGRPWRDTFLIGPQQTTRIAFVADNPGKWLLHCHMLEHAAAGMNTWFEVG